MQDTLSTHSNIDTNSVTNFVYTGQEPIFVLPGYAKDTNHVTNFNDYVVKTLNNNLPPLTQRASLFNQRTFVSRDMKMQPRQSHPSQNWMYGVVFSVLLIYLVLIKYNIKRLSSLWQGETNRFLLLLPAIFLFFPILALVGFLACDFFEAFTYFSIVTSSYAGIYFLILGSVFVYCFLKYVFIDFFGALFRMKAICSHYNTIQTLFYILDGAVLLPLTFLCFYLPEYCKEATLWTTISALCILMLIRLVRSLYYVLKATKFSKVYLFFYLCTLEFVPLIIIYKLLSKY